MCLLLVSGVFSVCATAAADVDYTITSTYEDIDWDTVNQYRTSLHNHSVVSDGDDEPYVMIEEHYKLDYDFLAMTDHSTTDRGWVGDFNFVPGIRTFLSFGVTGTPKGLTQERFDEMQSGSDRGGSAMLRVPFGNELNGASFNNTHINTWFADYGNGILGATSDYKTGLAGVEKAGGLSVINHPGEFTGMRDVDDPDAAYKGGTSNYFAKKFAYLLLDYKSCLGIDINSKGDFRTRHDRKLWDALLQLCVPNGRNVFAIASSDAHRLSVVDSGWVISLMEDKNVDNLRSALEAGQFFAGSRNNQNPKELAFLAEKTGLDLKAPWVADSTKPQPVITDIAVDDVQDTLTISADNAALTYWIANGEVIHVGSTIDLDDYSDKIGSYVRAEVFGEGGILYTQAFTLDYEGAPTVKVSKVFDAGDIFAFLLEKLEWFIGISPFGKMWNEFMGRNI